MTFPSSFINFTPERLHEEEIMYTSSSIGLSSNLIVLMPDGGYSSCFPILDEPPFSVRESIGAHRFFCFMSTLGCRDGWRQYHVEHEDVETKNTLYLHG